MDTDHSVLTPFSWSAAYLQELRRLINDYESHAMKNDENIAIRLLRDLLDELASIEAEFLDEYPELC